MAPSPSGLLGLPLRAPRTTLVVMLALTVVLGLSARHIRVDSSIENLLPVDDPDRVFYQEAAAAFGDEAITVIGVFADDVFAPATLARIQQLSDRLAAVDGVREVLSLSTVKGLSSGDFGLATGRLMEELPRTAEAAAAFRERVLGQPLYRKNIVSPDGRAAGISVVYEPMSDHEFTARDLDGTVRAIVAETGGPEQLAVTGIPNIKIQAARLMEGDTSRFTPLAALLVAVVLAALFRTVRGIIVPLVTVVIGVVWTIGLTWTSPTTSSAART